MKFMLKTGLIEAIQYRREENIDEVQYFFDLAKDRVRQFRYQEQLNEYAVVVYQKQNGHNLHILKSGEYILRNIDGTYEVVDEELFKKRYERVTNDG